jgi:hypothetical protein
LGVDVLIPLEDGKLAAYVEHPSGRVESNGTFGAVTEEHSDLPGYPGEAAEVEDDGYSCPACRGRFAPHSRKRDECRLAPDVADEADSDIDDKWFEGFDEAPIPHEILEEEFEKQVCMEELAVLPPVRAALSPWFVEVCGGKESTLAKLFEESGWKTTRITDSTKLESDEVKVLMKEAEVHAAAGGRLFVWWSLPCTAWTKWARLNLVKSPELIERKRHESLVLQEVFNKYNDAFLAAGAHVAFEWPADCDGWKCEPMANFIGTRGVHLVTFHGCMLGVTSVVTGQPLKKPWMVATTFEPLVDALKVCQCDKSHQHGTTSGKDTAMTAFYPDTMAKCIFEAVKGLASPGPEVIAASAEAQPDRFLQEGVDAYLQEEIRRAGLQVVPTKEVVNSVGVQPVRSGSRPWVESWRL